MIEPLDFSNDAEAKHLRLPTYTQIRPHIIQPAKDVIKVINSLTPAISAWRKWVKVLVVW